MNRKKIGRWILLVGIIFLAIALFMIFNMESSPWAIIILGLSILVNTISICMLIWK